MVMCLSYYVAVAVARQRLPARGWRVSACPPEAEAAGVDLTHSPIRSPAKVALRKNRGAPLTHSLPPSLALSLTHSLAHSLTRSPAKVALRKNRGAPLTHSLTHPLLLSNRIRRRNESAMTSRSRKIAPWADCSPHLHCWPRGSRSVVILRGQVEAEQLPQGQIAIPILTAGHGAPAQSSSSLGVPLTRRPHCHHRSGRQRPTDGRQRPRTPGEATSLRLQRLGADTFPHCS